MVVTDLHSPEHGAEGFCRATLCGIADADFGESCAEL